MPLRESTLRHISLKNQLQTIALLAIMGGFSWIIGTWLFGPDFAFVLVVMGVIGLILNPAISTRMIMKAYGANPMPYQMAPELYQILQVLTERAKLHQTPTLYYVP